jgi:hypothetical protein
MFIQVIQGSTRDPEGLRRQIDRWREEIAPGANGYLGSTGGITESGTVVSLARFESEEAARANSGRPEQDAWWNETSKYFEGDVTFSDFTDVETTLEGGSDAAGFVQVIQGTVTDRQRLTALEAKWMPAMAEARPDLIGSVRAWDGDRFVEAAYFTDEASARAGESSMNEVGAAPEAAAEFEEYGALMGDVTYTDLRDPWLHTP